MGKRTEKHVKNERPKLAKPGETRKPVGSRTSETSDRTPCTLTPNSYSRHVMIKLLKAALKKPQEQPQERGPCRGSEVQVRADRSLEAGAAQRQHLSGRKAEGRSPQMKENRGRQAGGLLRKTRQKEVFQTKRYRIPGENMENQE